jgi:hypothetical protein
VQSIVVPALIANMPRFLGVGRQLANPPAPFTVTFCNVYEPVLVTAILTM